MILNIFSRNIEAQKELFVNVMNTAVQQNTMLLIQDAVYFGLELDHFILSNHNINNIYALKQDVVARGLVNNYPEYIKLINYNNFVTLVINHDRTITY